MQKITPFLWFEKNAKEAAEFYVSVFKDAKIKSSRILHDTPSGDVENLTMELFGQDFALISGGPLFKFNESISFVVSCETQEEVDDYWEKLSADPKAEQCGWLKDKYGLSWQIVPKALGELLGQDKSGKVMQAMLQMKKIEIAGLKKAYEQAQS